MSEKLLTQLANLKQSILTLLKSWLNVKHFSFDFDGFLENRKVQFIKFSVIVIQDKDLKELLKHTIRQKRGCTKERMKVKVLRERKKEVGWKKELEYG